jgi:drug/metabolite transporter (DMT)-like permease
VTGATRSRLLLLCLATVYLVWGSSYAATRIGVQHLPPLLFGGIRFTVAGLLMLGIAGARGLRLADVRGEWRHVAVMGFVGVTFVNGLQVWAMQWVPSQTGALLNASSAFWIVAFGLFGRRAHRPGARVLTGIAIGFVGVGLLVWPGLGTPTATPLLPQLVILVSCVGWAVATIYLRNIHTGLDVIALTALQMLIGGIVLVLLGVAGGETDAWRWSAPGLLSVAWLTVFSACCAYTAYAWLAQNATPAQVGTYSYVNPAIATLVGYLLLDEVLTPVQLLGTAVIVGGVLLVNWPTTESIREPIGD